jgi:hypothetical protein
MSKTPQDRAAALKRFEERAKPMENRREYRPLTIDALREYRESLKNAPRAEQENPVRPNETRPLTAEVLRKIRAHGS